MNILVTGGNGYIGQYLVEHFKNDTVIKTTRMPNAENERCLILEDESTFEDVCKDIDIVIHTATMDERKIIDNPKEALLINTYGTRRLYMDAVKHKVKAFIYLSTFHVYGDVDKIVTEQSDTNPKSDYGLTHLFAEQYLRQLSEKHVLPTAVVRLTNGIGLPGKGVDKWYLVVNDFCRTAIQEGQIHLKSNGLPRRDFIDIRDICKGIEVIMEQMTSFDIYNISSEKTYSIREIAIKVCEIYEKLTNEKVMFSAPMVSEEELAKVQNYTVSSQKLRELGWYSSITIEETIESILRAEIGVGE